MTLLALIVVFGAGILLSMSLFGVALARVMSAATAARLGQAAALLMAVTSIVLGGFWMATRLAKFGGAVLIALGAAGIWGVLAGRVYGHSHRHGNETAPHWHLHVGRRDRHPLASAHSHLPTIVGAAALSSVRALTALAPFGGRVGEMPLMTLLALIVVFGAVLLSMSLFGVALARVMSAATAARLGQAAALLMAVTSIVLGGFWMATA